MLALALLPTELTGHGGLCLGHRLLLLLLKHLLLICGPLRRLRGEGRRRLCGGVGGCRGSGIRPRSEFFWQQRNVILGGEKWARGVVACILHANS